MKYQIRDCIAFTKIKQLVGAYPSSIFVALLYESSLLSKAIKLFTKAIKLSGKPGFKQRFGTSEDIYNIKNKISIFSTKRGGAKIEQYSLCT